MDSRIQRFKKDYNQFLTKLKKNIGIPEHFKKILARPGETLSAHIFNMSREFLSYISTIPEFNSSSGIYIYLGCFIAIFFHDIGKLLPYFQYKLATVINRKWEPIPQKERKFSYHNLFGACIAGIFCDKLIEIGKIQELFDPNKRKILKYLVYEAILTHHSSSLLENFTKQIEIFTKDNYNEQTSDLKRYFANFIEFSNEMLKYFLIDLVNSLDTEQNTQKFSRFTNILKKFMPSIASFPDFWSFIKKVINETCMEFEKLYLQDESSADDIKSFFESLEGPSLSDRIIEIQQLRREIISFFQNQAKKSKDKNLNHSESRGDMDITDLYVIQCFISSLLCDLDIWDARFYKRVGNDSIIPFSQKRRELPSEIIENYISNPFGIISNQFNQFIPNPNRKDNIMDHLRNSLFEETRKHKLLKPGIYTLNSPTGAGKTLNLLNLALNSAGIYSMTKNDGTEEKYTPKIIYALPFVSIGTQVATQIQKILEPEQKKLINSSLITIDNYTTENLWIESDHDNEEIIFMGDDARWLISSWRSQFVVTTFVKLFHALLKPLKRNYLKFHRIANSIIILDEVQCLPIRYWEIIRKILLSISRILNCIIFSSTATQPAIFKRETIDLAPQHLKKPINKQKMPLSEALNRYEIKYFPQKVHLEIFLEYFQKFLSKYKRDDVLLVVNTKNAAIKSYKFLLPFAEKYKSNLTMLSTLVLPLDRKLSIEMLKESEKHKIKRNIVISTQVIEAGVNLSFKYVFRDLAPLDSIIQVAGRCNRHFEYTTGGRVYVFEFLPNLYRDTDSQKKQSYFHQVYKTTGADDITKNFLRNSADNILKEDDIFPLEIFGKYHSIYEAHLRQRFKKYFMEIKQRNNYMDADDELLNLKTEQLAKGINLIETRQNQIPIYLITDEDSKKLHENWSNGHSLNSKFYLYCILISNSWLEKLKKTGIIQECFRSQKRLYYYIEKKDLSGLYSTRSGFILNDFPEKISIALNKI
ncbi:MAG: CRISPR-associated helicase Cas3' [Candidatus Helarchaeota archaeon]